MRSEHDNPALLLALHAFQRCGLFGAKDWPAGKISKIVTRKERGTAKGITDSIDEIFQNIPVGLQGAVWTLRGRHLSSVPFA